MKKTILNIFNIFLLIFLFFFRSKVQAKTQNNDDQINRPKVSIIIPVCNTEKWLPECMESLIRQSLKKIEIICVDDGSTDNSGKILDKYAAEYDKKDDIRIKVIHKKNSGCGPARNTALEIATGEYITFLDSDDYIHPKTYEYAYNYAKSDNVDILKFGYRKFKDGQDNFNVDDINLDDAPIISVTNYLKHNIPHFCWCWLFKFDLVNKDNKIRFLNVPAQDTGFTFMSMAKAKKMKCIPGKFYNYRKFRLGQLTLLPPEQRSYERLVLLKHIVNSWKDQKCLKGNEALLIDVLIRWTIAWRPDIALANSDEILSYLDPYIYDQNIIKKCSKKTRNFIKKLKEHSKLSKNENNKSSSIPKRKKTNNNPKMKSFKNK